MNPRWWCATEQAGCDLAENNIDEEDPQNGSVSLDGEMDAMGMGEPSRIGDGYDNASWTGCTALATRAVWVSEAALLSLFQGAGLSLQQWLTEEMECLIGDAGSRSCIPAGTAGIARG